MHENFIDLPDIPTTKVRPLSSSKDSTGSRVILYDKDDLQWIQAACSLTAEALDYLTPFILPGITTQSIDDKVQEFAQRTETRAATLNYKPTWATTPFPAACCVSINDEVNHGIPSPHRFLRSGDIVNVDITLILDDKNGNSWYGDSSRTFFVGTPREISPRARQLVHWTYEAMMAGIKTIRPGGRLGDIGFTIGKIIKKNQFSVVSAFTGHGVGLTFHDAPQVLHEVKRPGVGLVLEPGMVFTVEPMVNEGSAEVRTGPDGWTTLTADGKLSAQFEHTVVVTDKGGKILTTSPQKYTKPPYESLRDIKVVAI